MVGSGHLLLARDMGGGLGRGCSKVAKMFSGQSRTRQQQSGQGSAGQGWAGQDMLVYDVPCPALPCTALPCPGSGILALAVDAAAILK